ncbi:hypothetical protein [Kitasatospora kifunensis]|uniref:Transposase n=1 Tax=Kitasatospora kifunensis TaxID=58351 RepID=A0A7W7RB07_KITKI|nr:hypothetical protein [Kitasatospora kifunensis]
MHWPRARPLPASRPPAGPGLVLRGPAWINQVERWFGLLTDKLIRRGVHTSVKALEDDIKAWIDAWNQGPRPFTWTKTADEILKSLADCLAKINPPSQPSRQCPPS